MSSDAFEDKDPRDTRITGLLVGTVMDRRDPLRKGRVRVKIPGIFSEGTPWAKPLTLGGGTRNNGIFFVPELDAEVAVLFNQGDPDEPYFLSAHWGAPEGESEVPAEAIPGGNLEPDNRVIAVPGFRIELNATPGERMLRITNQKSGDCITLDQEANSILIRATTRLVLEATGEIVLDAPLITVGGRPVRVGGEGPI